MGDREAAKPSRTGPPGRSSGAQFADERVRRLRAHRMFATGLLVLMAAIFFATHAVPEPGFWVRLIRSGAEGGLVGGLADWFAVTALFRHPFGIPVPHTAIVPRSKERIAAALGRFIEDNFLTRDVLLWRLREADLSQRILDWVRDERTAPSLARWTVGSLPPLLRAMDNRDFQLFAQRTIGEQIANTEFAPMIGSMIETVATTGEADRLFDTSIGVAVDWLENHREQVHRLVQERSRWWIPKTIDRRVATAIVDGLKDVLVELRKPDSDARQQFREALRQFVLDLNTSAERRAQVNDLRDRLLSHPDVQNWLSSIWNASLRASLEDLHKPTPRTQAAVEDAIRSIATAIADEPQFRRRIDRLLERAALTVAVRRGDIGAIMQDIVEGWDAKDLSDKLELAVGSDLQYIRMNGTLVGAGVGTLLFVFVHLVIRH